MTATIKYTCSQCRKERENWTALTYTSPSNYEALSEEDKKNIAELGTDLKRVIKICSRWFMGILIKSRSYHFVQALTLFTSTF